MAAPNFDVNRFGADNGGSDKLALFLKKFGGEVIRTFQVNTVTPGRHFIRTITQGKSAQFPSIGVATAAFHTPGVMLTGQSIPHSEVVINVDRMVTADVSVAEIDEMMNHYDVRGPYGDELGNALGRIWDSRVLRMACRAARTSARHSGNTLYKGGSSGAVTANSAYRDSAVLTTASNAIAMAFKISQTFDEKNVPMADRYLAVLPATFYLLVQSKDPLNRDWGGNGSYSEAKLPRIANLELVSVSPDQFPGQKLHNASGGTSTELDGDVQTAGSVNAAGTATSATGSNNSYNGDFRQTAMIAWQKGAVATTRVLDITTELEPSVSRQGTLMVSKYVAGHGVYRSECAIEVTTAAIANQTNTPSAAGGTVASPTGGAGLLPA